MDPERRVGRVYEWSKRALDTAVAGMGLLLLLPLMGLIVVLVVADSGRPIFYCPTRTGRYGRPFSMYKFRSMVVDARRVGGLMTGQHDPRVTRVGAVLRAYKLDELPQLVNVLKGEMSLVGPRPEHPEYAALYSEDERMMLDALPGLTDLASIELIRLCDVLGDEDPDGVYERNIMPLKNQLRMKYVRERSFWGDVRIIVRTIYRIATYDLSHLRRGRVDAVAVGQSSGHLSGNTTMTSPTSGRAPRSDQLSARG